MNWEYPSTISSCKEGYRCKWSWYSIVEEHIRDLAADVLAERYNVDLTNNIISYEKSKFDIIVHWASYRGHWCSYDEYCIKSYFLKQEYEDICNDPSIVEEATRIVQNDLDYIEDVIGIHCTLSAKGHLVIPYYSEFTS